MIPVIATPLLLNPVTDSPDWKVPSVITRLNLRVLELKSTTFPLAPEVTPVTVVPVSKKVGSTKVIEGITGSSSLSDS